MNNPFRSSSTKRKFSVLSTDNITVASIANITDNFLLIILYIKDDLEI